MMGENRSLRWALIFSCAASCTLIVGIIFNHPETHQSFSLLYIPSRLVHRAFAETQLLNSRSEVLKNDLENLEKDLGLSRQRRITATIDRRTDDENGGHSHTVEEGHPAYPKYQALNLRNAGLAPRLSEDIDSEAKDRITSGEWSPGMIEADQAKGFYPRDGQTGASNSADQRASLLALAEQQAKLKLKKDFQRKEEQLKRVFRYKEVLLSKVAQQLAQGRTSSTPPSAASASEFIGPSGIVVGDGTRLRKDTLPVGSVSSLSSSRRPSDTDQQLAAYSYAAARKAAEARLARLSRRAAGAGAGAGEDREAPAAGEWSPALRSSAAGAAGAATATQELTWPPPLADTASPLQELATYKGDYNFPTSGQVERRKKGQIESERDRE
jgi:hypothetical protein